MDRNIVRQRDKDRQRDKIRQRDKDRQINKVRQRDREKDEEIKFKDKNSR